MKLGPSRRAILGGAGALVALPFLKSLLPRAARAGGTPRPKRLMVFFIPDGVHIPAWTPGNLGPDWALTPTLAPLAPVKSKVTVISGLGNAPAAPQGGLGHHASGTGAFLTCTSVRKSQTDIVAGISMDQVAANAIGGATRFPSLQFGTDGGGNGGNCDSGYSCSYIRNISWAGPTQPLPKMVSPRTIFDVVFGGADAGATAEERARRRIYKTSVLDSVSGQAEGVMSSLGKSDREKLDEYLTSVREIELRIGEADACPQATEPTASVDLPTRTRQILDLMAIAVQCDLTRVMTFMLQNGLDNSGFPWIGVNEGHHDLSHHGGNAAWFPKLQAIDTWEIEQLSYLLQKLDAIDEGEGTTALDNSLIYVGSECSNNSATGNGDVHYFYDLPVLVCGKAGGSFVSGQHVRHVAPVANLFTSMLNAVGVANDRFGDNGTGPLPGLNV